MAVRTAGRCQRVANRVATPSGSPIVLKARGPRKREMQKRQTRDKKIVVQRGSLTTRRFTTRGVKNTQRGPKNMLYIGYFIIVNG